MGSDSFHSAILNTSLSLLRGSTWRSTMKFHMAIRSILQTSMDGSSVIPALFVVHHAPIARANVLAMLWQFWPTQNTFILCWNWDTLAPPNPTEVLWVGVPVKGPSWMASSPCVFSRVRSPLSVAMPSGTKAGREDQLGAGGTSPQVPIDLPFPGASWAGFQSSPFSYNYEKPHQCPEPFGDTFQFFINESSFFFQRRVTWGTLLLTKRRDQPGCPGECPGQELQI